MSLHQEIYLENDIGEHLADHGWTYSPTDEGYDRAQAFFPEDVLAWVQETQPEAWEMLVKITERLLGKRFSRDFASRSIKAARSMSSGRGSTCWG